MGITELEGIEKTMLYPLWGRYSESIKPDGLIRDEKCVELVEKNGIDLSQVAKGQHAVNRLAWMARAWNTDAELRKILAVHPASTIVSLGCGLDTTFFRIDNAQIAWYDVDLPEVIAVRRQLLGEQERSIPIAGSVLERATFARLTGGANTIVTAFGLLYYFSEEEVKVILENISTIAGKVTLIFDYCSQLGVAMANKMILGNCGGVRMIWYADDVRSLHALSPDLTVIENYLFFSKIFPLLKGQEAQFAMQSDLNNISSIAIVELEKK
jgi:O-methyltransferase involved in polyketide biosynthesis